MRIIFKHIPKITTLAALSLLLFSSCEETVNELQEGANAEIGAFARVVESTEDKTTNLNNINGSEWNATIEFVDEKDGALVESYTLYATFRDNTIESETAPDFSILDEVLIDSWDKADFVEGEKYPRLSFNIKSSDLISKLGLDASKADGGDNFVLRGEIELSDGRSFSSTNSGQSINSELFYSDAFTFTSQFVCIPATPPTGDYKVTMVDTYGDGWQGDGIKVTIDGTEYFAALASGGSGETIITVPDGAQTMKWEFTGDQYPSEVQFKIYGPTSGDVIADVKAPSPGAITLNLCKE